MKGEGLKAQGTRHKRKTWGTGRKGQGVRRKEERGKIEK
jgi:hypothetical protein